MYYAKSEGRERSAAEGFVEDGEHEAEGLLEAALEIEAGREFVTAAAVSARDGRDVERVERAQSH
jgi:hypothetical protein